MDGYADLKPHFLQINQDVSGLLDRINAMPGASRRSFESWENVCRHIETQLSEERIRVAVVGTIKSGKSTLINALFSGDYLKRGAGVVTSMVTKIRRGERLKATLFFKSWDQVNADIQRALVLFPTQDWRTRTEPFDIREAADRKDLEQALHSLDAKKFLSNDSRNLNSLYLSFYLRGYDRVEAFLSSGELTREFFGEAFSAHRDFSGNEVLALYLRDIHLEIDSGNIDSHVEIADCQGSDSPNPLHMAMIQDYLLQANFLIYVISSRTGIRQADINFLSMIKKMGIMDHAVFIINCDLSEHESYDDLARLIAKVREDLSIVKADPEVYAYSALLSLFTDQEKDLAPKDRQRLAQWTHEEKIAAFSRDQEKRFHAHFRGIVTRHRHALLFKNHFERLKMILSGLDHWVQVNRDVLAKGADEAARLLKKIKTHEKKTGRVKTMVKSTLDGALAQIKREIRNDVDGFFDLRSGEVIPGLMDFIRTYDVSLQDYKERLAADGFSATLYVVFQDFQHGIDSFMAEHVNPRIFQFVRAQEDKVKDYFETITGPYEVMVNDALSEYTAAMEQLGLGVASGYRKPAVGIDLKAVKSEKKLELPPASATMNYSNAIKTEAILRLGMYNVFTRLRRIFRQPAKDPSEDAVSALKDTVRRMKKETEESVVFHFKNYKENIKFQYIFKLVDAVADAIHGAMMERFHDYTKDISHLADAMVGNQVDKDRMSAALKEAAAAAETISKEMTRFGESLKTFETANLPDQ